MINNIDWSKAKFRASSLSHIAVSGKESITIKQLEELTRLQLKEKVTDRQRERINELIEKRDALPQLATGTISYLQEYFINKKTGCTKEVKTDAILKGIQIEGEQIEALSNIDGVQYGKNDKEFVNDFITGTPDIITKDSIIDIKSSYDVFTMPLFEDRLKTEYYWQMQAYMWLLDKEKAEVVYILSDAPQWLIAQKKKQVYFKLVDMGYENEELEILSDLEDSIIDKNMLFNHLPLSLRIKRFKVDRLYDFEKVKECITMAREYLQVLEDSIDKTLDI